MENIGWSDYFHYVYIDRIFQNKDVEEMNRGYVKFGVKMKKENYCKWNDSSVSDIEWEQMMAETDFQSEGKRKLRYQN